MNTKIVATLITMFAVLALLGCIQPAEKPAETPTPTETPTITEPSDEELANEIASSVETLTELADLEQLEVDLNELSDLASELTEEEIVDSGIDESTFE